METYKQLLDRVYKELPDKATSSKRFQMPKIDIQHQGNKTFIRNFRNIMAKLRREPKLFIKYMAKELALPITIKDKMLIIQGDINNRLLIKKVKDFVNTYVLCNVCGKPDTKIIDGKKGVKMLTCEACGARTPLK